MLYIYIELIAVAILVLPTNSWDIAVTAGDQIDFYTNTTKDSAKSLHFRDLSALAYDPLRNVLIFADRMNDNASISSYHLTTKKYQTLVRRKSYQNIQGIAFDPVDSILFWIDSNERSIFWMSLKGGSKNRAYGNVLLKLDYEIPRAIAVDSCRRYVYWTNTNITKSSIERVSFDGSNRKVIVESDLYMPVSLTIDQNGRRLYWADDREGIHYSIGSSDLEGKNQSIVLSGTYHHPNAIAVSEDSLYWIDWGYKSVWRLPKNQPAAEPQEITKFLDNEAFGIVANYSIENQTKGVEECKEFYKVSRNRTSLDYSVSSARDMGLFCLHGALVESQEPTCKCSAGYSGERCEMSVCANYCFSGECSYTEEYSKPVCKCPKGFTGVRCEYDVCANHCLNQGECYINSDMEPVCHCGAYYKGARCELLQETTASNKTAETKLMDSLEGRLASSMGADDVDVLASGCEWDDARDPMILVLGALCGSLCVTCTVLIAKILKLRRRPRIKKRIIVSRNVTPLTARPDQCEITIENCCNMNICETPCFEPRGAIRPTVVSSKSGKEEKVTLITNMEQPDDSY